MLERSSPVKALLLGTRWEVTKMSLDLAAGARHLLGTLGKVSRACIFRVLSAGPIPNHFAFIMDGNRRYAKKRNKDVEEGHKAGFLAFTSIFRYLYELGVKYITIYAFSIDNFKRKPEQVQILMDLLLQKTEEMLKQESIVNVYGVRVHFIGNLKLLTEPVRASVEKVMAATAGNTKAVLLVCVAYTSTEEIVHAVEESCRDNAQDSMGHSHIKVADVEKRMYMAVAPEADIVIRSSGETRLSNFLLWQSSWCPLYSPAALWPEMGLWQVVLAVLIFQRNYAYLEKTKLQS